MTDVNSGVDARVVAKVDVRTYVRADGKPDPYNAPCLRHARQKVHAIIYLQCLFTFA